MNTLMQGVYRFQTTAMPTMTERFASLEAGQSPHTLFVTCSDSRVDPSLITQTEPGELFVLRNVGNLVPKVGLDEGSAAVVEYAVTALGVRRIVVCGHSGCGAMGGLLNPESLNEIPSVARWVEHAAQTRLAVSACADSIQLTRAIEHNAATQLRHLMTHPAVARAMVAGILELEAWLYDIPTGNVEVLIAHGSSA